MFKIECFCEDKHLAKVLRLLASAGVYEAKSVPVVDATATGGKLHSDRLEGFGKGAGAVIKAINGHGHGEVTTDDIKTALRKAGLSDGNYGNVRNELVEKKVLKQTSRGHFEVRR